MNKTKHLKIETIEKMVSCVTFLLIVLPSYLFMSGKLTESLKIAGIAIALVFIFLDNKIKSNEKLAMTATISQVCLMLSTILLLVL